jgi:hypothetical protein
MLDYAELIDRLERLPVDELTCSIARTEVVAAEANVGWTRGVLAFLDRVAGKWARRPVVTAYEIPGIPDHVNGANELLAWMENSDVAVRFAPDWADDSFKNAA